MSTPHAAMSEADWLDHVLHAAAFHGWLVARQRPAETGMGWRRPPHGYPGAPALILARRGRVLLAELKSASSRLRPEQRQWLAELGDHGRLWRPGHWAAVRAELSAEVGR